MTSGVRFPFFIVTQRRGAISVPVFSDRSPAYVVAFTGADMATDFMLSRGATGWEFTVVSRPTVPLLIDSLREMGVKGICLDASAECGGMTVDLDQLV